MSFPVAVAALLLVAWSSGCTPRAVSTTPPGTPRPTVNQGFTVNPDLAARGEQLFWERGGCAGCHTIGRGRSSGPDLYGVTDRRQVDWLKKFIKETDTMLDTDPIAQALLKEHNNTRMPTVRLSDEQIDAIIHYIAQETEELSR